VAFFWDTVYFVVECIKSVSYVHCFVLVNCRRFVCSTSLLDDVRLNIGILKHLLEQQNATIVVILYDNFLVIFNVLVTVRIVELCIIILLLACYRFLFVSGFYVLMEWKTQKSGIKSFLGCRSKTFTLFDTHFL